MEYLILIIITAVVLIGAIVLTIIGLRNPQRIEDRLMQERLQEFIDKGEDITLEKLEMSQPITERVIFPLARSLGSLALKLTPQAALDSMRQKLEMSGMAARIDPTILLALQMILALVFGSVVLLVFRIGTAKISTGMLFLLIGVFMVLGYYFPNLWIQSRINKRQKSIRKALPDALDLLTVSVEAGLGFDAAMAQVSEKWQTELSLAFLRVNREIQLGKSRREALRDMADRLGVPELTSFVAAVIQSEQLGVSLAKVLRIQADQMRIKRRQHAEQEAHKAPLKMLIPMTFLIFPALIIVLITPAIFQFIKSVLFGLF